jgi:Fe2+ transport system protein B
MDARYSYVLGFAVNAALMAAEVSKAKKTLITILSVPFHVMRCRLHVYLLIAGGSWL